MPYFTSHGAKPSVRGYFTSPREALEPITVEILHSNSQCEMHWETTQQLNLTSFTGLARKSKVECTLCATT